MWEEHTKLALRRRGADLGALGVVFYLYFVVGLALQLYPPRFDSIMAEFNINCQGAAAWRDGRAGGLLSA